MDQETLKQYFDENTVKELKDAFRMFDADDSGDIDVSELGQVYQQLGIQISEAEIEDLTAALRQRDRDRDRANKVQGP